MIVSDQTFPELRRAFEMIECDGGGHLIGTVYPGEAIDMAAFDVPDAWAHLCDPAELALRRLRAVSAADFETFVIGEMSEQEAILKRQGDLGLASKLLCDFFNGWQPEDAPLKGEPR